MCPSVRLTSAALWLSLGLLQACRDAPAPFDPPELSPLGPAPYQLTFSPAPDVAPTWSADGEQVIYIAAEVDSFPSFVYLCLPGCFPEALYDSIPLPDARPVSGIVRQIPREGGLARKLLPVLQSEATAVTALGVAQSTQGEVAVFSLRPLHDRLLCSGVSRCDSDVPAALRPRLSGGFVRVREPGSAVDPNLDPVLAVEFAGRRFDTSEHPGGFPGIWLVDRHPFQGRFDDIDRAPARVAWAPDGSRLAFSDGLSLRTWDPATNASESIPGSEDGVDPAWSPDGEWIAFERLVRGGMVEEMCEHWITPDPDSTFFGPTSCFERRRSWTTTSRSLALIRPDGSGLRLLPEGSWPTWSPDSDRLYYESGGMIWSIGVDGTGARPVPNTNEGFEPAVSPDGRWLAFSRRSSRWGPADIWVVELGP